MGYKVNPNTFEMIPDVENLNYQFQPLVKDNLDVKSWSTYFGVDCVDIFEYASTGNGYLEYKFFIRKDDFTDEIQFLRPVKMEDAEFIERVKELYEQRVLGRLAKKSKDPPHQLQRILELQEQLKYIQDLDNYEGFYYNGKQI